MKTLNVAVVVAGLLVALALTTLGAVYAIDQWVAADDLEDLRGVREACR